MSTPRPPYEDGAAPLVPLVPSWREPAEVDAPPFEDAAETSAQVVLSAPVERYWTESRVLRLGATVAFVVFSLVFVVKIGDAFPAIAWLPYLLGTLLYGGLALKAWGAHFASEDATRREADREANKRLRMGGP